MKKKGGFRGHLKVVYISKSESRSHYRANSYGWVYYKHFCLNTWVSLLKKRPSTDKVKYWSATL